MRIWTVLRRACAIAVGLVLLIGAYDFFDSQFRLSNVREHVSEPREMPVSSDEERLLKDILEQPFAYLDRGRQSYVFVSQDGRYVIKFFDLHRYQPGWATFFSKSSQARMKRKMERLFRGYELAYERDRDNAMIVYQQLVPNAALRQHVLLIDRFGIRHDIDLGQVPFIIQHKGKSTRDVMTDLLKKGNVKEAKKRLRQLMDMYVVEYSRGMFDRDHNFMYNTGFVGETPMRLDVGRLRADDRFKDPEYSRKDLEKVAYDRTEGWLQRHFPQYRKEILEDLHRGLDRMGSGL